MVLGFAFSLASIPSSLQTINYSSLQHLGIHSYFFSSTYLSSISDSASFSLMNDEWSHVLCLFYISTEGSFVGVYLFSQHYDDLPKKVFHLFIFLISSLPSVQVIPKMHYSWSIVDLGNIQYCLVTHLVHVDTKR